jgi:hypothetical protein
MVLVNGKSLENEKGNNNFGGLLKGRNFFTMGGNGNLKVNHKKFSIVDTSLEELIVFINPEKTV